MYTNLKCIKLTKPASVPFLPLDQIHSNVVEFSSTGRRHDPELCEQGRKSNLAVLQHCGLSQECSGDAGWKISLCLQHFPQVQSRGYWSASFCHDRWPDRQTWCWLLGFESGQQCSSQQPVHTVHPTLGFVFTWPWPSRTFPFRSNALYFLRFFKTPYFCCWSEHSLIQYGYIFLGGGRGLTAF